MALKALELNDTFSFGKWKGKSVRDVAVNVPSYVAYLLGQRASFFTENVKRVIACPDVNQRVAMAKQILDVIGYPYNEDQHYSEKNVPFPPMCGADEIPF